VCVTRFDFVRLCRSSLLFSFFSRFFFFFFFFFFFGAERPRQRPGGGQK